MVPLEGGSLHPREQVFDPIARCGGDRERLARQLATAIGVCQIDLGVHDQDRGMELRVRADQAPERRSGRVSGRMQVEDDIHARQCGEGELPHAFLHQIAGIEQTGQVMPDVLDVALGAQSHDRQTCGLRLGAHDGEVDADETVEE